MKEENYEKMMMQKRNTCGIIAMVLCSIVLILAMMESLPWFYALCLLDLSFIFAFFYYQVKKARWVNIFRVLAFVFVISFVVYVVDQLMHS